MGQYGLYIKIALIIIVVIIIVVAVKKSRSKISQLTQASSIVLLPGEPKVIPTNRQVEIQAIGRALYKDIEDTPITGHYYYPYTQALQLTDNELDYLASYYKTFLSNGESLFDAIDSNYYVTSSIPQDLMARLAQIGQR